MLNATHISPNELQQAALIKRIATSVDKLNDVLVAIDAEVHRIVDDPVTRESDFVSDVWSGYNNSLGHVFEPIASRQIQRTEAIHSNSQLNAATSLSLAQHATLHVSHSSANDKGGNAATTTKSAVSRFPENEGRHNQNRQRGDDGYDSRSRGESRGHSIQTNRRLQKVGNTTSATARR